MRFIKLKTFLVSFLLLAGIFLQIFNIHDDCCDDAQAPRAAHHCCVQCCPSYNLAPVSQIIIKPSIPNNLMIRDTDHVFRYQDPFLDGLYRPPIRA